MSEAEITMRSKNRRKLEIVNELIEILSAREPIDYGNLNSTTVEELEELIEEKDKEVKALQNAWENLEGLLFNDLQITLQEKNQLVEFLGNKRKEDKQKKKSRGRNTQVWRSE